VAPGHRQHIKQHAETMPSKHQDTHKYHLQRIAKTLSFASTMEVSKHQDDTQEQKAKRPSQHTSAVPIRVQKEQKLSRPHRQTGPNYIRKLQQKTIHRMRSFLPRKSFQQSLTSRDHTQTPESQPATPPSRLGQRLLAQPDLPSHLEIHLLDNFHHKNRRTTRKLSLTHTIQHILQRHFLLHPEQHPSSSIRRRSRHPLQL